MRTLKKVLSLVLALALVMSFTVVAFADNVVTVEDDHTYKAYQIFTGNQKDSNEDEVVGQIAWSTGLDSEAFLTELKADETIGAKFANAETAADVAAVLSEMDGNTDEAALRVFAKIAKKHASTVYDLKAGKSNLPDGYYVIEDVTDVNGKVDTKNDIILQVTHDVTIKAKHDVPTSDKWVKDVTDVDGVITGWQKSADWDIGDEIPYMLEAKIQNDGYDAYTTYMLSFVDTMSAGLDYVETTSIYWVASDADNVEANRHPLNLVEPSSEKSDTPYENGTKYTWNLGDLKAQNVPAGAKIYIEYTAKLNKNAVIGDPGNPNQAHIEFSNNPDNANDTGKTVDKTARVFTYELTGNKVDEAGKPLPGASFTLYKQVTEGYENAKQLKLLGEDDENWYVSLGEVAAELDNDENSPTKGQYVFGWKGLDDGVYVLEESVVPGGYNKMENVQFEISASHDVNSGDSTTSGMKLTGGFTSTAGGNVGAIKNQKGVQLPETGGIGTTIFYVVGAILVAGAAILLVTKRRMNGAAE